MLHMYVHLTIDDYVCVLDLHFIIPRVSSPYKLISREDNAVIVLYYVHRRIYIYIQLNFAIMYTSHGSVYRKETGKNTHSQCNEQIKLAKYNYKENVSTITIRSKLKHHIQFVKEFNTPGRMNATIIFLWCAPMATLAFTK